MANTKSSDHQAEEILTKIEETAECPVCLMIPRDVPIPMCNAGHSICQDCKAQVKKCPTCQGKYYNNTNTLLASIIEEILHKCKFSHLGCKVKMKLNKIVEHEKKCSNRTVKCPYKKCQEIVKLKEILKHKEKNKCSRHKTTAD